MATKPRAAVASSPEVEAAAEELLRKGNALDAAVAGVFAACALSAPVLLGPVQILIGGAGAGLRALDGRVRQPGIGAPRPRGFQRDEEVPEASRVGAPWLPATLAGALATAGSATLAQVMAPALALAAGSPRKEVLARIAARGARAIEERPVSSELLATVGRPNGGLLTSDDLSSPRPAVLAATRSEVEGPPASALPPPSKRAARARAAGRGTSRLVVTLPWAHVEVDEGLPHPVAPAGLDELGTSRAIIAVDRHGTFAIAAWDEGVEGIMLPECGLKAPLFAEPVLRGVTRTRPGDPRPASAPMAFIGDASGVELAFAAFGARDAYDVLRTAMRSFVTADRIEAHGEARLVAASHVDGVASTFR
jgi:gamma-glutamyltranspeptidase/glutathione hydrolase